MIPQTNMGVSEVLVDSRQQEVRDELNRLLNSAAFRSSKRCREFLNYIVEKTIRGESSGLKERSIGVELFSLPLDFDTSQHTIVRVTASETRKKLAQYYQAAGGSGQFVRIDLPPGSYNAEFTWIETAPAITPEPLALSEAEPTMSSPARSRRWLLAGSGVGLLATGLSAWQWHISRLRTDRELSPAAPSPEPAFGRESGAVRIGVGGATPYVDRNGQVWGVDRYFSGGAVRARPSERIARTLDPDLYRRLRLGDFRYDIPLAPGDYELHLHFAETGLSDFISAESSGEGQRLFRVSANDQPLLDFFDVVADAAGANTADVRVFRNISPAGDGLLHLVFSSQRGSAMISGIELLPVAAGAANPLRVRCGWPTAWGDSRGNRWRADSFFLGGNALVRRTNPARENEQVVPDNALFASERWGHFSYALPLSPGKYRVTLKFCEGHLGPRNAGYGGIGSRMFDVYCNGVALMREFDIVKEAGGEGFPINRTFSGIRPNAQGKILLSFVPVKAMACVNAIEVIEA